MARRKKTVRRDVAPDPLYESETVSKFINYVMKKGKKTVASKIVYGAFETLKEKTKQEPLEVFEKALRNASPDLEVRPKRIGGATYQIPIEVRGDRKVSLAMRWILKAARSKKGKTMKDNLAEELMNAANNTGWAVKKKEDTHKMAEANRAFAHFR